MRRALFSFLLFHLAANAQPLLSITGPATIALGQANASVNLTLTGSTGLNLAALQWTIALPTGITTGDPLNSTGLATQGIGSYCGFTPANAGCAPLSGNFNACGVGTCIAIGLLNGAATGATIQADGLVATVPITIPKTQTLGQVIFQLANVNAVDAAGNPFILKTGAALVVNIVPSTACDVNKDGTVNAADVTPVLNVMIGKAATCPIAACNLPSLNMLVQVAAGKATCTL